MLDRGQGRCAGAAFIAGDGDVVGARLGNARRPPCRRRPRRPASPRCPLPGSRSSGRRSAAPDPRSSRCRGAAAARSGRRPASSGAPWRSTASTLWPGSCPPSPGFAPCATLIWIMSALTRYSVVTPKRPEATCLMAERCGFVAIGQRLEALRLLAAFAGVRLAADGGSSPPPASCAPRG
jgi:hypothetical protein